MSLEVVKWVRASNVLRKLPTVVMSACQGDRPADLAVQAGADAFIRKPFDFPLLVEVVTRVTHRVGDCRELDNSRLGCSPAIMPLNPGVPTLVALPYGSDRVVMGSDHKCARPLGRE
jgi:DNA-binding NtrC family response regulator